MRSEWKRLLKTPENKNFMQIPLWLIRKTSQVSGNALWLLCYLSNHDDGWDPGIQQISNETGWDPQKIKRYFKELVKAKFLCRTPGGKAGKLKTFRSNIHDWVFLSDCVYGPFLCRHCGYFPSHLSGIKSDTSILTGIKSDTSKLSGGIKSDTSKLSGGIKSDTSGGIKSDTTNYKKTRKGLTRKEVAREALPPPTSQTDDKLKLDAHTPKDLEEKPAKKEVKSKARRKPKFPPWKPDHPYSEIFTLLCRLEPYKAIFDLSNDTKTIDNHMAVRKWNIDQMTYIVRLFVTNSFGSEGKIKSPRRALATYVGNGEKWNGAELEKLRYVNNQNDNNPSGMKGIEEREY